MVSITQKEEGGMGRGRRRRRGLREETGAVCSLAPKADSTYLAVAGGIGGA